MVNLSVNLEQCRLKNGEDGGWTGKFTDGFSRPKFIPELDKNMTSINMKLINIFDNIRIYSDGDQNRSLLYEYRHT